MARAFTPKVVTANDLLEGDVIYLTEDDRWSRELSEAELITDEQALGTLRQEVRTAREVISPNVCRVFDLQELEDQELIAME